MVEGRLFVYLKTFEQFIAKNPNIEYRNLARTGVKIQGAPYLNYDDALAWIGNKTNSKPFADAVTQLIDNQGDCPDLATIFRPARQFAEKLLELALSAAVETEMLPDKFSGTNYADNKQIKELLSQAGQINSHVDSNNLLWNFLFEGKTKKELVNYRRMVREIDFPNKKWAAVQRNKEYFWALSEGCHWLLGALEDHFPTPQATELQVNA